MNRTTQKKGATGKFLALLASLTMIVAGLVGVAFAGTASAAPVDQAACEAIGGTWTAAVEEDVEAEPPVDAVAASCDTTDAEAACESPDSWDADLGCVPGAVELTPQEECEAQTDKKWIGGDGPNGQCVDKDSPGNSGEHKVTICHRHAAVSNPYNVETIDKDSVADGYKGKFLEGHGEWNHQGPVFNPDVNTKSGGSQVDPGSQWGDIIPSFTADDGTFFEGYNWDAAGQAIWNNGCNVPTFEYSKQVTITKTICLDGETLEKATASGEEFSVTSYKPITDAQMKVVDDKATISAEKAFDLKYKGYQEGACASYYYEKQITVKEQICFEGVTTNGEATGAKFWVSSDEPLTEEQIAKVDTDAQDSADAAFAKAYPDAKAGACVPTVLECPENGQACPTTEEPSVTPETPAAPQVVEAAQVAAPVSAPAPLPATIPAPAKAPTKVTVPAAATVPAAVPAGDGSQAPGLPMWALALIVVGALGAAAAGKQILGARN